MQVVFSIGILVLSICIYSLLGRAFCVKCRFCPTVPERLCIGFFLYFAAFQIVAEALILTKQKLHVLGAVWMAVLAAGLVAALVIIKKDKGQTRAETGGRTMSNGARLLAALMAAAVFCECATAVLMQRNIGWDFAYYIGNMTTSVATDTMYV